VGKRLAIICILSVILAGLCLYGSIHRPWLSLDTCLAHPEKYDGSLVTYMSEPSIDEITPDGFILRFHGGRIPVYSDTTGLRINEYVGILATFHKEGFLTAEKIVIAKNRRYKILLSLIPALMIVILFINQFKFSFRDIRIDTRNA
jgi:hypothetical protein